MSALPLEADGPLYLVNVGLVPEADVVLAIFVVEKA
jgi:hypothetical protein